MWPVKNLPYFSNWQKVVRTFSNIAQNLDQFGATIFLANEEQIKIAQSGHTVCKPSVMDWLELLLGNCRTENYK